MGGHQEAGGIQDGEPITDFSASEEPVDSREGEAPAKPFLKASQFGRSLALPTANYGEPCGSTATTGCEAAELVSRADRHAISTIRCFI